MSSKRRKLVSVGYGILMIFIVMCYCFDISTKIAIGLVLIYSFYVLNILKESQR